MTIPVMDGAGRSEDVEIQKVAQALVEAQREKRAGRLHLKVPEGFACYGVDPEQYVEAARAWLREVRTPAGARVVVVGLRSIGTTLSAVVAAELRRAGMDVQRVTIRAEGHPYDRKVRLDPTRVSRADWGFVVDEGPGHSRSSLFAASEALASVGVPLERRRAAARPCETHTDSQIAAARCRT